MNNKKIWKLIKNYKFKSIFFSYFKNMMVVVFIPLLIINGLFLFGNNLVMKSYLLNETKNKSDKYNILINSIIDNSFVIYNQYSQNESVNYALYSLPKDGMDALNITSEIGSLMKSHMYSSDVIADIGFFSNVTNYLYSPYDCNFLENVHNKGWYELYIENNKQNYIAKDPNTNNILITYNLGNNKNPPGIIYISISEKILKKNINQVKTIDEEFIIIKENDTNNVVYCSKNNVATDGYIKNSLKSSIATINNLRYFNNSLTLETKIKDNKLTVYTVVNKNAITEVFNNFRWVLFLYMMLNLILLTVLIFYISKKFYLSIAKLVANFELPTGNTDIENMDEILYINSNIIDLISNNQKFEYELADKLNKLKKSQTIALQTQINPHFIFNTLNLINNIIIEHTNGDSEEVQLICKLSSLLRNSLNTVQYLIPFSEELEYAKNYLDIELTKYCDIFKIKYEIDPKSIDCYTVKMILQPIIENAITHGVIRLDDDVLGIITIKTYCEENNFFITITDNGPGIESEKLSEIQKKLQDDALPENEHLGLYNVANRIKLIYGDKGYLKIESTKKGTTITLKQPYAISLKDITLF